MENIPKALFFTKQAKARQGRKKPNRFNCIENTKEKA
jgi:hypothetical protein